MQPVDIKGRVGNLGPEVEAPKDRICPRAVKGLTGEDDEAVTGPKASQTAMLLVVKPPRERPRVVWVPGRAMKPLTPSALVCALTGCRQ